MKPPMNLLQIAAIGFAASIGMPYAAHSDAEAPSSSSTKQPAASGRVINCPLSVGERIVFPFSPDLHSFKYQNDDIVVPGTVGLNGFYLEAKKVGQTQVTVYLKGHNGQPDRLISTLTFDVKEALLTQKAVLVNGPVKLPASASRSKPAFPISEQKNMAADASTASVIKVRQGLARLLTFKANVIKATYSDGGKVAVHSLNSRTLAVDGKAPGRASIEVRVSRFSGDKVGQSLQYLINVDKAPISLFRERDFPAEIAKRDERIEELERQLAENAEFAPTDTFEAKPAFPVTQQKDALKTAAQDWPLVVQVGRRSTIQMPSEITSVTYADANIALPHATGLKGIDVEGKKVGQTEIAIWMKARPETPFLLKVLVLETVPKPTLESTRQPYISSTPEPYKRPFPIKEVAELPNDIGPVEGIDIGTGRDYLLTFKSDIFEVNTSNGSILRVFAVNSRTLAITGRAVGKAQIVVKTRRSPSDTEGEAKRYLVNVAKAGLTPLATQETRMKSLEEELRKRDERIRELETQLAEKGESDR
jgi:Flp pilus assembly secretin CpaC